MDQVSDKTLMLIVHAVLPINASLSFATVMIKLALGKISIKNALIIQIVPLNHSVAFKHTGLSQAYVFRICNQTYLLTAQKTTNVI